MSRKVLGLKPQLSRGINALKCSEDLETDTHKIISLFPACKCPICLRLSRFVKIFVVYTHLRFIY